MSETEWRTMQAAREKGREEGAEQRNREIARTLLTRGIDFDVIVEATGFSIEKLMDLLGPTAYDVGTVKIS